MGLVCRLVEERGIATTYVATGRDLAALVRPPRVLFVNHPMGNNFGAPQDVETQTRLLRAALDLIGTAGQGGLLVDAPTRWPKPFVFNPGAGTAAAAASA